MTGYAVAARFANAVYPELMANGMSAERSARSVHYALWQLRDRYVSSRAWAPFVHVGPLIGAGALYSYGAGRPMPNSLLCHTCLGLTRPVS
jgi:hypothetical protein